MLHVISPAKTLDFDTPASTAIHTQPQFLDQSRLLIEELRRLSASDVSRLMNISDQLGELNAQRFKSWATPFSGANAKQAVLAFKGDVYTGMAADTFDDADLQQAQQRLRILSGLYGLLRPLDLIQPYRLEMGTRFTNPRGPNLYHFWGESITEQLCRELDRQPERTLVNLASDEYWSAVKPASLNARVITPVFKDWKNGHYKVISFFAKKARGMMSAFIIRNRLDDVGQIKDFNAGGYEFAASMSSANVWVFVRNQAT